MGKEGGRGNLRCLDPQQVLYKPSLVGAKNEKTKRILMWGHCFLRTVNTRHLRSLLFFRIKNAVFSRKCAPDSSAVYITKPSLNQIGSQYLNACQHCSILTQSVKQQLFPLFPKISFKGSTRIFILNCFNSTPNFILISSIVCKREKPKGFALRWPYDPQPRSRSLKVV